MQIPTETLLIFNLSEGRLAPEEVIILAFEL